VREQPVDEFLFLIEIGENRHVGIHGHARIAPPYSTH
jgi:hypothetical protein